MKQQLKVIRIKEVLRSTGFTKSTFYTRINDGLMPKPISLGERASGYLEHEIQEVLTSMAAGKSTDEIKALVISLSQQRQQAA